jgi:large subunit ribosomal protein L22
MTPNTPEEPPKDNAADDEQVEAEATPQAEGTAADVTGVGKDAAAAALQEGASEPTAEAGADEEPAAEPDEPEADEPEADEVEAAEVEAEADLAKTDEPEPEPEAAEVETDEAPARRRRGRRGRRGASASEETATPVESKPARRAAPSRNGDSQVLVRAQAKYVRTSARKARLVCDHIRGKSVQEARAILAHTPRAVARDWSKLLESAIANAEHNHELIGDELRVFSVSADEGPTLKRFRPRAMGRATRIRKRTSHLTITLTPKE